MLKTGVFVWLIVNCKSLNFRSVDIFRHNCIVAWIILFIGEGEGGMVPWPPGFAAPVF